MSLVRDALAKAEREAAARAAREQGLSAAGAEMPQPYRARRRGRWPFLLGLVAAAAIGAIAAVVLRSSPSAVESSIAPPPVAVPPSATPSPKASESPVQKAAVPDAAPVPASQVLAPPAAEPFPSAGEAAPPVSARTAAPVAAPVRAAPSGAFVREVELGDGRSIRLGGIAWSQAAPLAYLNGRLVSVGEYVEGFQVIAIDRELVVFDRGGDGNFILRLR